MSGPKFTPGPWGWRGTISEDGCRFELFSETTDAVIIVASEGGGEDLDDYLIAAAPDLYEALKSLLDMDVSYRRGPAVQEAEQVARAAIAKAEGKQ